MTDTEYTEEEEFEGSDGETFSPLAAKMPADSSILASARGLIGDDNSRIDSLATICLQDPVILIELLKKANALFFTGGGKPITTAKTAIVRLGSDVMREILDSLTEREEIEDKQVRHWYDIYRSRSRRIGIVTRIFSESVNRTLSEDCQTIGSMYSIGDMLAVYCFDEEYVELAESQTRSSLNYKLATNYHFDVEKMGLSYLRRNGIPEALLFALDRDARPREKERATMKPVCMASMELVDAFDHNKWERFAPGKKLAPKSAIRMLQLSDNQYLKIYERAS
ncbi:MAG: HDOD domain-containing protein, partial [Bdellovibrionales bacterium]|nr:HDOD domain-containing protein [Bdellovibrionales bacterium]